MENDSAKEKNYGLPIKSDNSMKYDSKFFFPTNEFEFRLGNHFPTCVHFKEKQLK